MKKKKTKKGPIQEWAQTINWEKRVKAVCKPCWEIKYCPYGPLVETFPLKIINRNQKSCRIFGHDCPVFYVAEPLTETKKLRNISRSIPRTTQFKVLKRENQICSNCGKSVKDENVEFDHIIPWSKGGSSDEHNITLLCKSCNRRKRAEFEDKFLVECLGEHIVKHLEPIKINIKDFILGIRCVLEFAHEHYRQEKKYPSASDVCKFFGRRKVCYEDEGAIKLIADMDEFFSSKKPAEIKQKVFRALRYRWGFSDRQFHTLKETSEELTIATNELLLAEASFVNRLGWQIPLTERTKKNWLKL